MSCRISTVSLRRLRDVPDGSNFVQYSYLYVLVVRSLVKLLDNGIEVVSRQSFLQESSLLTRTRCVPGTRDVNT
jgi:hypothetical protein